MRRYLGAAAGTAALFLAGAAVFARAEVTTARVEYHGWKDCWKLSNGTVELVYVPAIGRIMRYGRVGGPNMLWENPKLLGKLPVQTREWQNFGGDKLWPAPQTAWGWPPDPELDPGAHEVKLLKNHHLFVTGAASRKSGVRFEREIAMDETGTGVRTVNRLIATAEKPVRWAVWQITQVDDPDGVFLPRSPEKIHPIGYYPFPDNPPPVGRVSLSRSFVVIRRDPTKSAKIGTYSADSRAAAVKGTTTFTIAVEGKAERSADYPHGGGRQEVYTNADPDRYVELEMLGPVRELAQGRSLRLVEKWTLSEIANDDRPGSGKPASR